MPRAGSGWHYNMIHDLMKTAGSLDSRELRKRYHLEGILTEVNCNIGVLSTRRLTMLLRPAFMGNTFVIKAHSAPTVTSRLFHRLGLLRIAYIYRDPRDAMLSAFEYGRRATLKGRPNAFSHLTDFETTMNFMVAYVNIWQSWSREKNVLAARYEDLLTDYENESTRLVKYLQLNPDSSHVKKVIADYRPAEVEGQTGLHFYKGKIGRFRQEYDSEQQARLIVKFGKYLPLMGYAV
jgi:hypothetical protein